MTTKKQTLMNNNIGSKIKNQRISNRELSIDNQKILKLMKQPAQQTKKYIEQIKELDNSYQ